MANAAWLDHLKPRLDRPAWAAPPRTRSFLFTDLEDSTRLWDEHPDAMRVALARHDAILREALAAHRGTVVKSTGDGAYAGFAAPATRSAAAAAVAAPHGTEGPDRSAAAPGSASTPRAARADGDYFGPALNRPAA